MHRLTELPFQMIMIFELELPALTEFFSSRLPNLAVDHAVPFVTVLLSIWGVACQLVVSPCKQYGCYWGNNRTYISHRRHASTSASSFWRC